MIAKLSKILAALGINAVPAAGWFFGGWTSGTTLLVYWFESVAAALFIAARILRHRKVTNHSGHTRYKPPGDPKTHGKPAPFLSHFLPVALIFSGAHAVFLAAILLLLTANGKDHIAGVNWNEVFSSCGLVILILLGSFLADLPSLSKKPFRWMEMVANRNISRVMAMHLALLFGLLAAGLMNSERGFFTVFVVLKTMNDLSAVLPQWEPKEAPGWLASLMNRIPSADPKYKNKNFEDFWKEEQSAEINRIAANEKPC